MVSRLTKRLVLRTSIVVLAVIVFTILTIASLQAVGIPPITTMTIDPAAPNGENGWYTTNATITLSPDVTATTYYNWDLTPDITCTASIFAPEGIHDLSFYSIDTDGDTETPANTATVKVDVTDPTDPSVSSPSHTIDTTSSDQTVTVGFSGATDMVSGVDGYSFSFTPNTTGLPDTTVDTAPIDFNLPTISGGGFHTVGLEQDGTVVAAGRPNEGQISVLGWTDVKAVASGGYHTVGLKEDGTVVATGSNIYGQTTQTASWTGIKAIAAGLYHTVGLRDDGTVVAVGAGEGSSLSPPHHWRQSRVSSWTGIKAIAAGQYHTIGLKEDGTVVAAGNDWYGQVADVWSWSSIKAIAAGGFHTVGLEEDGSVVAVGAGGGIGDPHYGQKDVSSWTGIKAIAAGQYHTVGLEEDGTVVAVGRDNYGQTNDTTISTWSDVAAITAERNNTVGLREDGTMVAAGNNEVAVSSWTDIRQPAYTATSSPLADGTWWFNLRTKDNAGNWTSTVQIGPFIIETASPAFPNLALIRKNLLGVQSFYVYETPTIVGGDLGAAIANDWWVGDTGANSNIANIVSADFDGDTEPEMAIVRENLVGAQSLSIYETPAIVGDDLGVAIATDPWIGNAGANSNVTHVASADFDGDTVPELALIREKADGTQRLMIYEVPTIVGGDLGAAIATDVWIGNTGANSNITHMAAADFDGDSTPELALIRESTSGDQSLSIYETPAIISGNLGAAIATDYWIGNTSANSNVTHLTSADFDGDTTPELSIIRENISSLQSFYIYEAPTTIGGDLGAAIATDWWIGNTGANSKVTHLVTVE